jgi:hypothetical protein
VASTDVPVRRELKAVYWDTSDLRLAREGITLRHRSGEGDDKDGWHLKLPVHGARVPDASTATRDELHAVGEAEQIPDQLRDLVTAWARNAVLGPVATLVTQRTLLVLRDEAGVALAEVTDDLVSVLNAGHVAGRFREIEVEDAAGGPAVRRCCRRSAPCCGRAGRSAASSSRRWSGRWARRPRPRPIRRRPARCRAKTRPGWSAGVRSAATSATC